ncbi:ribonucleases P/MRP protein subunit POP1-domain-containing protein [Macrophomina phaseolina]|uniref:Ribonucleases P/MRP protein subunit POP1-domain-containing protein n=1 Tax=Macrophomina phaseolina TaxID=35725 RepID=A0ABQ8GXM8_9PEZI|nr:ribonucleases P/MRP protein subunit POP1-domain-containing protein [Macrophomina phaseolina]
MADKRKQPPSKQQGQNGRDRKRAKTRDARSIATQSTGTAFKNGEVDVDKFVKAREFEIKALEDAMNKARKGLTARAFQGVPRELRRRTASHNVKRVPKRLRARAAREMLEDNTPTVTARRRKPSGHQRLRLDNAKRLQTLRKLREKRKAGQAKKDGKEDGKNEEEGGMEVTVAPVDDTIKTREARVKTSKLKNPPTPPAKFRKRQLNKQWLPTHMFHSKRAHMTPPLEPLWRFAIPLAPTMKCYRPTHRASTARGAVAWDMSYMSTIGLHGSEKHLVKLLEDFGVGNWAKSGQKWRDGTRTWDGWLYAKGGWPEKAIAPVTVIWCAKPKLEDLAMTDAAAGVAPSEKKDRRHVLIRIHPSAFLELWVAIRKINPPVTVEDLRWEIGSIEITGPGATEALRGVLWPINTDNAKDSPSTVWKDLVSVTNLGALPPNPVLGFEISDPRLHHPPRTIDLPNDKESHSRLMSVLSSWPPDRTQNAPALFCRKKRLDASRTLPSQKSINRRKAAAMPNTYPEPQPNDPAIPILLFASRTTGPGSGTWTLLLPWKCVSPIWNSLMYYPLSTGANVRFGGLNQKRQLAFEAGVPFFPADYPGTKAGKDWDERETEKRKAEWERRPKGKRFEWGSLRLAEGRKGEVGKGWACDWGTLRADADDSPDDGTNHEPAFYHVPPSLAEEATTSRSTDTIPNANTALSNVCLTIVSRGTPKDCARIYRLPTTDEELRKKWLALFPDPKAKPGQKKKATQLPRKPAPDAPEHVQQAFLAASLLSDDTKEPQPGTADYPPVPEKGDLIGFVTAGNFNLGEGKPTAVGGVVLKKLVEGLSGKKSVDTLCIVRNAGEAVGRLARWKIV